MLIIALPPFPNGATTLNMHCTQSYMTQSVAMHALGALFWRETSESYLIYFLSLMASDKEAARALNRAVRDGHDLLEGGVNCHAFQELLQEYVTTPSHY